jgi:hydrogenase nickel incorporation protein HypB
MCDSCGCGDSEIVTVELQERILSGNARTAQHNRDHFAERGVLAVNLMGSPGSGKTALLEATARAYAARGVSRRIGAMSGDLETDLDGERLRAAGIPALTITTGSACHLDARMVHQALHRMAWKELEILFVENVGNLVCPAVYDLGQTLNVVALSVTEGADKPLKYPVIFRVADAVVLTKVDLLPYLPEVEPDAIAQALARTMPEPHMFAVSAKYGTGRQAWIDWLEPRRADLRRLSQAGAGSSAGLAVNAVPAVPHGH